MNERRQAVIGPSISIDGTLEGGEDLVIDGSFEGQIEVPGHRVTVGKNGKVKAEIRAGSIVIEGELTGNLTAEEQAVVRGSGKVSGDIEAPRVALDEGCRFKGRIDMEPSSGSGRSSERSRQRGESDQKETAKAVG